MNLVCLNCKYYEWEYYEESGRVKRYPSGFCVRTRSSKRKRSQQSCQYFSYDEAECKEELWIRRQELLTEIEELTEFLSKIKALAGIVVQLLAKK